MDKNFADLCMEYRRLMVMFDGQDIGEEVEDFEKNRDRYFYLSVHHPEVEAFVLPDYSAYTHPAPEGYDPSFLLDMGTTFSSEDNLE